MSVSTNNIIPDSDCKEAEAKKEEGNVYFKKGDFDKAVDLYTAAIELNPNVAAYYVNRSMCYLKKELFSTAFRDISKVMELDKNYLTGCNKGAIVYVCLGRMKQMLRDLEAEVTAKPDDENAILKFQELTHTFKKPAYELVFELDDATKSVADTIDCESIVVEDDYAGPSLDDGKVTEMFMLELMECYKNQRRLHTKYAYKILLDMKQLLMKLPTLVDITIGDEEDFTICGDIHGQYYDLLNIFELNGLPSEWNPYLFNGDFVDRGPFSVECIFVLFGFKLLYPEHVHLIRGNHESRMMNMLYGFEGEVKSKYTTQMVHLFAEVFNWLPLACCLNKRVLVMHGGLFSKYGVTLEDIAKINRNRQPPKIGLMRELLWSDPQKSPGVDLGSKRGIKFGPDSTYEFLVNNKLDYIIRSHELKKDGYEVAHDGCCITVFSAPNYCDSMGNKGAYITLNGKDMKPDFKMFEAVSHPDVEPLIYPGKLDDLPMPDMPVLNMESLLS